MSDLQRRLAAANAWLEAHINFERAGDNSLNATEDSLVMRDPEARLEAMRAFLEILDNPQDGYPAIHVTGTNGKTSVTRICVALLNACGLNAGSFTSPHLESVNERIQLNNAPVDDVALVELLEALQLYEPLLPARQLSYFELLTASAFRYFSDAPVNAAVVEVGVGGLWDSTNVLNDSVAIITNIELDHLAMLGNTRAEIAKQKAGIIHNGSPLITAERDADILALFEQREPVPMLAIDKDFGVERNEMAVGGRLLSIRTPNAHYEDVFCNLHGVYQGDNVAVGITAVETTLGRALGDNVVRGALESVSSPGRMEVVGRSPLTIIDAAHNTAGAKALSSALKDEFGNHKVIFVIGLLAGHDADEMLAALEVASGNVRALIACRAESPRAIDPNDIARCAKDASVPTMVVENIPEAVAEARSMASDEDIVVVTGSLYVVGPTRTATKRSTGN